MEEFKQEMIRRFVKCGKRHRKLAVPIIAVLAACLTAYYMVREVGHKLLQSRFRRRLACVMMVGVILFTQTEITDLFVFAKESDTAPVTVAGFAELPGEVREQRVSLGTAIDELTLPSELTMYIAVETGESSEASGENSIVEDAEASEEDGTEENTEASEEDSTEENTVVPEEDSTEENTVAPEEDSTEENTEAQEDGTEENTEVPGGSGTTESEEATEERGALEETSTQEAPGNSSELGTEVTVELPEYHAEPDGQKIQVLELEEELETEQTKSVSVTWKSAPEYDGNTVGEYVFTPVLPEGYVLEDGVSLPEIKVTVEEKNIQESDLEIELIEPDWDDPFVEAYNISTVLAVPGEWESYDWQVYAGPYAGYVIEDFDEDEDEAWVSGEMLGLDELVLDGKLYLDKGMLYTYAFRCVVEKDGELFATAPFAENEDALVMPQYDVNLLADFQSGSGIWKQSSTIAIAEPKSSTRCFDIYGVQNDSFYQTTFMNNGYYIASEVGGTKIRWKGTSGTEISMGGSLKGQFSYDIVYNGRYAKITYTVKNTGSTAQSFKVGSSADVMIDKNDKAPVVGTPIGLKMEDGKGKTFNLVVPDATTTWYGYFSNAYINIFTNLEDKTRPYTGDSGMAWSWSGSVAPGGTWTRSALIGIGELPDPPAKPTITVGTGSDSVAPGETVTVSGTATAGTTVHILAGGTEYEAAVGSDGKFSAPITVPTDAKDSITFICWAVSNEGGISETVTKTLNVVDKPWITLTDSATTVTEGDTLNEAWYQNFIKTSVGTVSHTNVSTTTPGTYTVTYTAKVTGYTDATATLTVTVLAHPIEIAAPTATRSGTTSKFNLSATLTYPGATTITETGFVWGIMQNPTTTMCNGKKSTGSVIKTKGGTMSVTTDDVVDGVTYYCRAYVIAGGVTYYSAQTNFGLNAKNYGTFTVSGSGNTFTITRSSGSDGAQTVYYRTKNGSAIAGTHYTAAAGSVTFAQGETSKTVTVTEQGANQAYNSKAATAYSNADREYFFEIYRVDGGGTLGTTTEVKRTLTNGSSYTVPKALFNEYQIKTDATEVKRGDYSDDGKMGWMQEKRGSADIVTMSVTDCLSKRDYWVHLTGISLAYQLTFDMKEVDDGYQHFQILPGDTLDITFGPKSGGWQGDMTTAYWRARTEHGGSSKNTNYATYTFPSGTSTNTNSTFSNNGFLNTNVNGGDNIVFPVGTTQISVGFSASGTGNDKYYTKNLQHKLKVVDKNEPQLLGVGTTESTSKYREGDTFYISLIFDEIVDGTNSSLGSVSVSTSWGTATYAGGADTNVLYFRGTVTSGASGELKLNSITNPGNIKDMCSTAGTTTASGTGNAGGSVNNTTPTVTVGTISNANGTLTATVSATNHNTLKYAWTQSSTMPATGWLDITSGSTATTRQTSGTWYLHALATNTTNGKTAYTSKSFTIPASGTGAVMLPELTVTADNSNWAKERTITVTKSPSNATVSCTGKPSGATVTASGSNFVVNTNGVYTFTLTSGSDTVVKQVTVSKIDRTAPTATITEPGSGYLTQSDDVTFTITANDTGGSGVKSVTGKWNNSNTATLTLNSDGTYTYTAKTSQTANYSGTWKLTVTVTDNAGNTYSVSSQTYTVNKKAPIVTVTKGTTESNGAVNYTYSVNANGQTIQSIELPDGTITTATSGSFKLTAVGTYYVTVTDTAGHVVQSTAMTVSSGADGEPPEIRLSPSTEDWVNATTGVIVTVSVYDNIAPISASYSGEGTTNQNITLTQDESAGVGNQAKIGTFTVKKNGTYTVTAKDAKGNTATETITISNIDSTAPTVTATVDNSSWKTSHTVTITASDADSGVKSVKYAIVNSATATSTSLTDLTINGGKGTATVTINGENYLYCVVEDNVGNKNTCHSGVIKVDTVAPTITVTGGTTGAASLTLNAKATTSGSSGISSFTVKLGSTGAETALTPSGTNYTVSSSGTYTFTATSVSGKTTTKTVYVRQISFDSNNGTSVASQIVVNNGKAVKPEDPTKTGYTFGGWYTDNDTFATAYNFNTSVTTDKNLYAKWKPNTYTVTLNTNNGTINAGNVTNYTYATGATLPTDVTKNGYTFSGWYASAEFDGTEVNTISATDIGNKVFWAKWKPVSYNITYDLKEGTANGNPASYTIEDEDITLNNPERDGYTFTGWTGSNGSTEQKNVTITKGSTGDKTYTAHWTCAHKNTTHTEAKAPTCQADGTKEYWTCNNTACNKVFSNAECTTETTAEAQKITKLSHEYSYTASGEVITEKCLNGCNHSVTLTLIAGDADYNGSAYNGASTEKGSGFVGTAGEIHYVGVSPTVYSDTTTAPTNAGTYEASVTVGGVTARKNFEIKKKDIAPTVSISGWTYGDTPNSPSVTGGGSVTYHYYTDSSCMVLTTEGNSGASESGGQPKDAGTYYVKAEIAATTNYNSVTTDAKPFTIAPKDVTITGVSASDKVYNGSTETSVAGTPVVVGLVAADEGKVSVSVGTAAFADKNIGIGKTVTFSGFELTGDKAGNYSLSAQPASVTANISKAPVTIVWEDKTYTYSGNPQKPDLKSVSADIAGGDDCSVTVSGEQTNAGTYTATASLTGTDAGNYTLSGEASKEFTILQKALTGDMVKLDSTGNTYSFTGSVITPAVTVSDGTALTSGDYTISGETSGTNFGSYDLTVTGQGNYKGAVTVTWYIKDPNPPTGSITVATNGWSSFLNTITFGLFFKETQTVTITGKDGTGESGVDKLYYYLSETEFNSESDLAQVTDWTELSATGDAEKTGSFTINPDKKFIIYAKITDMSGNALYINSNGIVLDATAPVIEGVTDGKSYCEAKILTISDANLDTVTVNGSSVTLSAGQYTLAADGTKYTIVASDKAGNSTTVAVTVNNGHTPATDTAVAPTCTATGLTEGKHCSVCKEILVAQEVVDVLGHNTEGSVAHKDATCTESGVVGGTYCTRCDNGKAAAEAEIAALGHNAEGSVAHKDATCTETGVVGGTYCTRCDNGKAAAEAEIAALGHNAEGSVAHKDATCTESGVVGGTYCTRCDNVKAAAEAEIAALGHNAEGSVAHKDATCTESGVVGGTYCTRCDNGKAAAETIIPALGHNTEGTVAHKDATCTKDGVVGGTYCTRCDNGKAAAEAIIPALGHNTEGSVAHKDATCTESGVVGGTYCTRCDNGKAAAETIIPALGHNTEGTVAHKDATCTESGVVGGTYCTRCNDGKTAAEAEIAALGHMAGGAKEENRIEATCTEDGSYETAIYCEICHAELSRETHTIGKTGHNFGEWEEVDSPNCTDKGSRKRVCTACGYTETESLDAAGHSWESSYTTDKVATCTADGSKSVHCSKCDAVKDSAVIPAMGHDYSGSWGKDADGHWKECSRCDMRGQTGSHSYDNAKDTSCNICGYIRAVDESEDDNSGNTNLSDDKDKQEGDEAGKQPGNDNKQEGDGDKKQLENDDEQPELVGNDEEPLVITGEKVITGNVPEAEGAETTLEVGKGKVVVTVICEDEDYTAGVADTVAVANVVLTPEQIQRAYNGENVETRVYIQDISGHVPVSEKEAVEECIEQQNEIPDLQLGMYIDISLYVRIGDSDWNPVTQTKEPIDVVIGIPEELQGEGRSYYIIRSHEGGITLLYDMDNADDTITIRTEQFSTYAIAYTQMDVKVDGLILKDENKKCSLCHICPTFLGICYFIWLAVVALAVSAICIMHRKNRKKKQGIISEE